MDLVTLLGFSAVFVVAAAAPGPAIVALVARVLARGSAGVGWFCGGLIVGDLVWLGGALIGLSALAAMYQPLFALIRYAGAAYLLWLAVKLWTAPAPPAETAAPAETATTKGDGWRAVAGALALTLGNPKTMLFYVALLPTLVPVDEVTPLAMVELAGAVALLYAAVLAAYVMLAARARRAFTSPRAMRNVNRVTGAMMAGTASAVIMRN